VGERLIHELLPELRADRGWSTAQLSGRTKPNIGAKTIEAIEHPKNAGRVPEIEKLEAFAYAFDIPPETFYEWPIAVARKTRPSTPAEIEAARSRMRDRLRARARQRTGRPSPDRDTKRAHQDPTDGAA
jgi:transcriptional regulator with XRE-family HTH domain